MEILNICDKNFFDKDIWKKLKKLYIGAFPANERAPFYMLKKRAKQGRGEMLAAYDNNELVGMAYIIGDTDLGYLFYFAIMPELRGKGYGSKILSLLRERYSGGRLFLAREQLDKSADNYSQRVKRHEFYLKNGFADLNATIREAGVVYDVMITNGKVSPQEYADLMLSWAGKLMCKIVGLELNVTE